MDYKPSTSSLPVKQGPGRPPNNPAASKATKHEIRKEQNRQAAERARKKRIELIARLNARIAELEQLILMRDQEITRFNQLIRGSTYPPERTSASVPHQYFQQQMQHQRCDVPTTLPMISRPSRVSPPSMNFPLQPSASDDFSNSLNYQDDHFKTGSLRLGKMTEWSCEGEGWAEESEASNRCSSCESLDCLLDADEITTNSCDIWSLFDFTTLTEF